MNVRRAVSVLTAVCCAMALSGCALREENAQEETWVPDRTALEVTGEGTITETIIDTLDQSYYSESELKSMIDSSVSEYNSETGTSSVTVESFTAADGAVTLVLDYQSGEDFAEYNNVYFFNGSMLGAQMEGYLFSGDFRKVSDGVASSEVISHDEPLSHKEYQVLITDGTHEVKVPGRIQYVSANAQTISEFVAVPSADDGSQAEGLALSSGETYQQEDGSENSEENQEEMDKSLVYVIYDY